MLPTARRQDLPPVAGHALLLWEKSPAGAGVSKVLRYVSEEESLAVGTKLSPPWSKVS